VPKCTGTYFVLQERLNRREIGFKCLFQGRNCKTGKFALRLKSTHLAKIRKREMKQSRNQKNRNGDKTADWTVAMTCTTPFNRWESRSDRMLRTGQCKTNWIRLNYFISVSKHRSSFIVNNADIFFHCHQ
jgi:hypothetical protein